LIDFGIAKEFVDLETIYLSNSLGTELYKPIEQYEKRGQFGAYTDIYALAVTLYHLLTGAAPGGGSPLYTSKARKDAHDKGWGGNLDEHLWGDLANAGVSESTQAAIKAGMEIDPSQRPQSMTEFRKLLGLVKEKVADSNELDPDITQYCMVDNRGTIKIELGREERILRGCERTLKIQTDNHDIWGFRGDMLYMLGRFQEALSSFDRALEIQSNSHQHWVSHGMALYRLSRYQEALSSFDHALEIQPSMPWRLSYRIDAQYKLVRAEDNAEDDFDRGLIIQSVYSDSWFSRGVVLSRLGRDEEAILSYDRALEIQPSNQECFEYRQIELEKITATELTK
jgi:tetratricopeptide (TPR) repeat protein